MSSPFGFIPPVAAALDEEEANEGVADGTIDPDIDPDIDSVEKDREASKEPIEEVELNGEV